MQIEFRDLSLKYPKAIREDKIKIVLDWLLEFRFSSIELLSLRLGSNKVNMNRFFNQLIDEGVIQLFKNANTKNERYVMLTAIGVSYLEAYGRNTEKAVTRVQLLGKYSQILHDISVQYAVLKRLSNYSEVIADRNIPLDKYNDRPDALLLANKNYWVAIEYERWRKANNRIYYSLNCHAQSIINKRYSVVIFLFELESDKLHYEKLFNQEAWECYRKNKKNLKFEKLHEQFKPDSYTGLRQCFKFLHEVN